MSELAVLPDNRYRGKGIARLLTDARLGWAKAHGMSHFVLRTDRQSKSVGFYQRNYFATIVESLVQEVGDAGCGSNSTERIIICGKIA